MALKTPGQYEASLRRMHFKVYMMGELVQNPVEHPIIRPSMNAVKMTYALAQVPEYDRNDAFKRNPFFLRHCLFGARLPYGIRHVPGGFALGERLQAERDALALRNRASGRRHCRRADGYDVFGKRLQAPRNPEGLREMLEGRCRRPKRRPCADHAPCGEPNLGHRSGRLPNRVHAWRGLAPGAAHAL